jgi:hypothetical protein
MPKTDREAVIEVFAAELPQTARLMNVGSLTDEIVFGPGVTPDDDERPAESIYDRYGDICKQLANEGILNEGEALGFTIYGLTPEYQERLRERVVRYLDMAAARARDYLSGEGRAGMTQTDHEMELKAMNAYEAASTHLREVGKEG